MISSVWTSIDARCMFPLQVETFKFKDGSQCIRRFRRIIRISKFSTGSDDSFWCGCLHSQQSVIDHMHAPVSHQPAGIIPKPAKIEMKAVLIERSFLRRSQPFLIINTGRGSAIGFDINRFHPSLVGPCFYQSNIA